MSSGKEWKIPEKDRDKVKELILSYGAIENDVSKNQYQIWRLRLGKSIFDLYSTGTLYNNQATSSEALELRDKIEEFSESKLQRTGKEVLIGLDETGKGEVIGHEVLCGVLFPLSLSKELGEIVGVDNTKSRKSFEYWDSLFSKIDFLRGKGLDFITQSISPLHLDLYHTNKIMDVVYKKIISELSRNIPLDKTSIVIDDYQIGDNLKLFLNSLEKKGVKVFIEEKADDTFLEAKLASIIAKRNREYIMKGINAQYKINSITVGSGNVSDPDTVKWLEAFKQTGKPWPWFIKQSFSTIRVLDGNTGKVKKIDPPIRHELISEDARRLSDERKLSTEGLRVSCPKCRSELKGILLTFDKDNNLDGRCTNCKQDIPDLNTTLLYYNGKVIPDSSIISGGVLSKDLNNKKFFENFTILLHPVVMQETDNRGGKSELGKITDIASYGRIRIVKLQDIKNYESKPDIEIINSAKSQDAIILTADMGQYAEGLGIDIFSLSFRF